MEALKTSSDVLFILLGAIMVLAMHAGFAFLELGTVRRKNQVNSTALGGLGGVAFMSQLVGTAIGIVVALAGGFAIYGLLKKTVGIRLDPEDEFNGADIAVHRISATPEREERA